jgi:hypothetical protein
MAFVILMWLVVAGFLLIQAVYVIRTGQTMPFLVKSEHRHPPVGQLSRLGHAFAYLFPSIGILLILAVELRRAGSGRVRTWFGENFGLLFFMLLLATCGALYLALPAKMLRWTLRNNPELAENKAVLITMRLVGLGILLVALFALAKL